jgi:hypothetical protein
MPGVLMQPVRNTDTMSWVEGHCLVWRAHEEKASCSICEERGDEGIYRCTGCGLYAHGRCAPQICLVCVSAFHPEQIRAAFARCFASLFYTYRKFLQAPTGDQKKSGMLYRFNTDNFIKSLPHENANYVAMLQQTQSQSFVPPYFKISNSHQVSTNSFTNVRPKHQMILLSCSSIRLFWQRKTEARRRFSSSIRAQHFFPILATTSGVQRQQIPRLADFLVITERL